MYWNLHKTFFFHPNGRVASTILHLIYILMSVVSSLIRLSVSSMETFLPAILVPLLIFGTFLLRIVLNLDRSQKHKPVDPETATLVTILQVAHTYLQSVVSEDIELQENTRLSSQITAFFDAKHETYERFKVRFGFRSKDPEIVLVNFIMYLFEELKKRNPANTFKITVYQTYYLLNLNLSMTYLSILLSKLSTTQMSFTQKITLDRLYTLVQVKLEQIYLSRAPFCRKQVNFYISDKIDISDKEKKLKPGNENCISRFDIFWAMSVQTHLGRLVDNMSTIATICLAMYDKLSTIGAHISEMHKYVTKIYHRKQKINFMYQQIEDQLGIDNQKPLAHILPYALYALIIENDRTKLAKLFKIHKDRTKLLSRAISKHFVDGYPTRHFDFQSMVCLVVACSRTTLGRILYFTKNTQGVFGIDPATLEDKNICSLMSEGFQSLHLALMQSFARHHDKSYLGLEKTRYLRLDDQPVYTQTSVITKVNPSIHQELSFILLVRNEDTSALFMLLNSERKIAGYSRSLELEYPAINLTLGKQLASLSPYLDSLFSAAVRRNFLQKYAADKELLEQNLERLGLNTGVWENATYGKDQHRILPVEETIPEKEIHFDQSLVLGDKCWFDVVSVQTPPEMPQAIYFEVIMGITVQSTGKLCLPKNQYTEPSSHTTKLPYQFARPRQSRPRLGSFPNLMPNQRMRTSRANLLMRTSTSSEGDRDSEIHSLKALHNQPQLADNRGTNKVKQRSITKQSKEDMTELDKESSCMESLSFKNKVQLVIKKRSRTYFWKELVSILLVQVLVWSMGVYMTQLMSTNFYDIMGKLIDLRRGFHYMSAANTYFWCLEIGTYDLLLEQKGYLLKGRYNTLYPKLTKTIEGETWDDFRKAMRMSLIFQGHVYRFDWKYSFRFLEFKTNYTLPYSVGLQDSSTSTNLYSLIDYHRIALYIFRQLRLNIASQDFNSTLLRTYIDINGLGLLEKILTPTILFLMDYDFQTYNQLIFNTTSVILTSIVVSLLIANAIIAIIFFINKKIVYIYSAFDKLYDFEIVLQKQTLVELKSILALSVLDGRASYQSFNERVSRKTSPVAYLNYRKKTNIAKLDRVHRTFFSQCFGMIYFALVTFVLMEAFNLAAFLVLNDLVEVTQHKLNMMVLTRSLISASTSITYVTKKMYEVAILRSGIDIGDIQVNNSIAQLKRTVNRTLGLFNNLDNFTASSKVYEKYSDTLGFEQVLDISPCSLFDNDYYGVPKEICLVLAEGYMNKTPLELYKWMRLTSETMMERVLNLDPNAVLSAFSSRLFFEYQLVRKGFIIPSFIYLSDVVYDRLIKFHERTGAQIHLLLGIMLAVFILLAVLFNLLGVLHTKRQIKIGLSSLQLLPGESLASNPYVAAVLNVLTKY